jgi:hypothetical protein
MVGNTLSSDPCKFAALAVTIEKLTQKSVTFLTRSASNSGNPEERLLRAFTVPLDEVCTDGFEGGAPPVEMTPGAAGTLFLSKEGWRVTSDGFGIYGADIAVAKTPECAAITPRWMTPLSVAPTSIAIRGHLQGEKTFHDIELLGPDAAESQSIVWGGADYIDLRLTPRGGRRVGLKPRTPTARMWPIWIKVKGSPMIDMSVSGEIDILDNQMADSAQHIEVTKPGAPITISVTQDGCNAFHVTPQIVAELSGTSGRAQSPCHGCLEHGRKRTHERATRVARSRAQR